MDSRTNGDAFSATPPESRYSKPEGPVDASVLIIAGRTYAESKVRSATKPGTGQEVWRIPDRERSSCYPTGIRRARIEHLEENVAAAELKIDESKIQKLDRMARAS